MQNTKQMSPLTSFDQSYYNNLKRNVSMEEAEKYRQTVTKPRPKSINLGERHDPETGALNISERKVRGLKTQEEIAKDQQKEIQKKVKSGEVIDLASKFETENPTEEVEEIEDGAGAGDGGDDTNGGDGEPDGDGAQDTTDTSDTGDDTGADNTPPPVQTTKTIQEKLDDRQEEMDAQIANDAPGIVESVSTEEEIVDLGELLETDPTKVVEVEAPEVDPVGDATGDDTPKNETEETGDDTGSEEQEEEKADDAQETGDDAGDSADDAGSEEESQDDDAQEGAQDDAGSADDKKPEPITAENITDIELDQLKSMLKETGYTVQKTTKTDTLIQRAIEKGILDKDGYLVTK